MFAMTNNVIVTLKNVFCYVYSGDEDSIIPHFKNIRTRCIW